MPTIVSAPRGAFARRSLRIVACGTFAAGLTAFAPLAPAAAPRPAFHVEEATIESIQRAILAHELTSTELVKLYFARIKPYNGTAVEHGSQLNALSTLNPSRRPSGLGLRRP